MILVKRSVRGLWENSGFRFCNAVRVPSTRRSPSLPARRRTLPRRCRCRPRPHRPRRARRCQGASSRLHSRLGQSPQDFPQIHNHNITISQSRFPSSHSLRSNLDSVSANPLSYLFRSLVMFPSSSDNSPWPAPTAPPSKSHQRSNRVRNPDPSPLPTPSFAKRQGTIISDSSAVGGSNL